MKPGLGLQRKLKSLNKNLNIFRFCLLKTLFGFDAANAFLQKADKASVQSILKKNGAMIGKNCDIETGHIFHNCKKYSNLIIGNNCHIGKNCFFDLRGRVVIEDNVVISMQNTFITHQDMNQSGLKEKYPAIYGDIVVKSNSYIGANAMILQGVIVNGFALVAAGSVVTKNVAEYSMVGGVPARFIKKIEIF
jgi:acetyltransferase-like isoleucine patch superfamily enzyme